MKNTEELLEQEALVQYLELKKIKYSALIQDTPAGHHESGSWRPAYNTLRKNKRLGICKGVPDLMCILKKKNGYTVLLFIEMKKKKGGVVSKEQKEWGNELNKIEGVFAIVSNGAGEAINFIDNFIKINI